LLIIASCLFSQEIVSVAQTGQLTGQPSINNTGAVNVYGTDLGSIFLHSDGRIYFLFGDTFGPPGHPESSGDWRSNTMAYSSDTIAADGILFDGWIVDPPVGELSVIWNPYLQRWLMMYLNENTACIEARFAEHPFGPWSAPLSVVCGDMYPALYGAFMHPRFTENNGQTVYFLMSQYGPYNVFLMKAMFKKNETGGLERFTANTSRIYRLYQNSPNPFNDQTTIRYRIANTCFVTVKIYNLSGQEAASLINRYQTAGYHTLNWDASGHASCIYFCRLSTDRGFMQTRKIILLR